MIGEPEKELQLDLEAPIKPQLQHFSEDDIKRIITQANQWADYNRYTQLMNHIAGEMKEIAYLPSERVDPDDSHPLLKVEFPKEGGVLTTMEGFEYPFRGYPHHEFVEKIDFIKKVNRAFVSGLYHQMKKHRKILFLTLLPGAWIIKDFARSWIHVFYRNIERFRVKKERYSEPIREIYRAFSEGPQSELRDKIRDLLCMVLEFDNAYRFRAQDVLPELNYYELAKNPRQEMIRLLDVMSQREHVQEVRDTWKLIKMAIRFYLLIDREMLKILVSALEKMDMKKVGLSVGDKSFCVSRKDYSFGFILKPSAEDQRLLKSAELRQRYLDEKKLIQLESTKAHESGKNLGELDKHYEQKLNDIESRYSVERKLLYES